MDAVVATGYGTIGNPGVDHASLAEALRSGSAIELEGDRPHGTAKRVDFSAWIRPMQARRMSVPSRFAVAAALEGLRDSGRAICDAKDSRGGISLATSFGPASYSQRLLDQILDDGPCSASPSLFTECVANAPAAQVSIRCRMSGPNFTIAGRENACLTAIARAHSEIVSGRATWMLAGAVEEITPLVRAVLTRFGAVGAPARPFDRRRNGYVPAEGSTVWVLEEEAQARARGARSLARIRAHASAFDATAGRAGWGRGVETLASALARMLRQAEVEPSEIDLIVSGASGSRDGDRIEARTLRQVWKDDALPAVTAPKAILGEYGGGLLGAALTAVDLGVIADSSASFEIDPELEIEPASDLPAGPPRLVLVSGISSGGTASWLLLERP